MSRRSLVAAATGAAALAAAATMAALAPWRADTRVVVLEPGRHAAMTIDEPTLVRAEPGAVVDGGIVIASDGVRLQGVSVQGGSSGITVRDADDVVIEDVTVAGSTLHGIEVVDSAATISGCQVTGLTHAYGQGIEIRNSNGRARSAVRGCRVEGGREGIVTHVSRVEVRDNVITATTNRALAITEMSEAIVAGNHVHGVTGVALYCGDMSRCDFRSNRVRDVDADPSGVRGRSGQSAVGWYHSTVRFHGNDFDGAVDVYHHSVTTSSSPLSRWPAGWSGALPAAWLVPATVAGLFLLRLLLGPALRPLGRHLAQRPAPARRWRLGRDLLITTGVAQLLHVGEHVVQVVQTHVFEGESRSGVAGARFDVEWLHFGFNTAVLAGLVGGVWIGRHHLARHFAPAMAWLVAAAAVQAWHVAEHVARVAQHVQRGISPAPGIIGDDFGLVWFHFAINVPVMAGLAVGLACIGGPAARRLLTGRARQPIGRPAPSPAG